MNCANCDVESVFDVWFAHSLTCLKGDLQRDTQTETETEKKAGGKTEQTGD